VLPVGANPHDTVSFDDEALRIVAELRAAGDSCYSPANPGSAEPARPRPSSAEHKVCNDINQKYGIENLSTGEPYGGAYTRYCIGELLRSADGEMCVCVLL
jgi:hypothetical protein